MSDNIIEIIDSDDEVATNVQKPPEKTPEKVVKEDTMKPTTSTEARKSRRKSALNPQHAEVEFETIVVDEESERRKALPGTKSKHVRASGIKLQRLERPMARKTSEQLESMFNKFITAPETMVIIRTIGRDRVRLNALLSSKGIPPLKWEINPDIQEIKTKLKASLK